MKCKYCRYSPDATEDGSFYCPVIDLYGNMEDDACEEFTDWIRGDKQ